MEYIVSETIIACLILVAGLVVGFLVGKSRTPDNQRAKELEIQLRAAQNQLQNYKQSITSHFKDTAELVNNMTRSYENVYNHLAHSAHKLCDDEMVRQQLQSLQQSLLDAPDKETSPAVDSELVGDAPKVEEPLEKPSNDFLPKTNMTGEPVTADR